MKQKSYMFSIAIAIGITFGFAFQSLAQVQGCNELFFSEYIEGSSNNKCLEIYNPTGFSIFLGGGGYKIQMFFNGSATAGLTINLTDTIPAYGVYVVCNSGAAAEFLAEADQTNGSGWYNGDDAVALVKGAGNTLLDVIGQIGVDPGTAWTGGGLSTLDRTLRRKAGISSGDANGNDAFDPSIEWEGFPNNTSDGLGSHSSVCAAPAACAITNVQIVSTTCNDNGTSNPNDDAVAICFIVTGQNVGSGFTLNGGGNYSYNTQHCGTFAPGSVFWGDFQVFVADIDDPACSTSFTVSSPGPCSSIAPCSGLFISEYVEGSGFNKCIEIYNSTGSDINLADYGLFLSFNGGTFENTISLMGIVKSGDVYVICNTAAAPEFIALADQLSPDLNFNGNDVVVLEDQNTIWDAIGQLGNTADFGLNVTLRRKFDVQNGDNNPFNAFSAAAEWDIYPQNTSWGLGYHRTACVSTLPIGWNAVTVGCPAGSTSFSGNTFTQTSNCFNPAAGQDDLTFSFQQLCGDGEIIAQYNGVTPFGFAGLMMRESVAANSKYVWMFMRANNNVAWSIRSTTGAAPLIDQKPHLNRTWMKLTRTGNVFRGFLSTNGSNWQMIFQSAVSLDACVFVGLATHSNVDGNAVTSSFRNVSINGSFPTLAGATQMNAISEGTASLEMPVGLDAPANAIDGAPGETEKLAIWPNPAGSTLEVTIPDWNTEEQMHLQVNDMQGRPLIYRRIDGRGNRISLDLSALNAGMYLLTVRSGEMLEIVRFVKQ